MKVLLLSNYNSRNNYVRMLIDNIDNVEFVLSVSDFWNINKKVDIIHIQWPEEIFNWKEFDNNHLEKFKKCFFQWKERGVRIVLTLHNLEPHSNFLLGHGLYKFLIDEVDALIHLGDFSANLHKSQNNFIIRHPIENVVDHKKYQTVCSKKNFTLLSYGAFRKDQELDLIKKAFKINQNRSLTFKIIDTSRGKSNLSLINRAFFKWPFLQKLFFGKNFIMQRRCLTLDDLNQELKNSDLILISRSNNLNSGIIFDCIKHSKPFVAPKVGNLTEYIDKCNMIGFKPDNPKSLSLAINSCLSSDLKLNFGEIQNDHLASRIGEEHYQMYLKLLRGKS